MNFIKKGEKRVSNKYVIFIEGTNILTTKVYGPFDINELKNFLEKVKNKDITILKLLEGKEYGN